MDIDAVLALAGPWQDESDKIGQLPKYSVTGKLGKKVQRGRKIRQKKHSMAFRQKKYNVTGKLGRKVQCGKKIGQKVQRDKKIVQKSTVWQENQAKKEMK